MKLSLGALAALAIFGLGAFACADSENETAPNDTPDGSTVTPETDAGQEPPADAGIDAADVSVPTKTCSDSQLCRQAVPAKNNLVGVWADGAGGAWSVTTEGNVLKLDASGWKVHASDLGALVAIWGSSPTDIWAVGEKGAYHSTGGAFTASTLPGAFPTKLTSVWGTAANDVWVTGNTENAQGDPVNVVLRFNGTAWANVTVPAGVTYYRVWGHTGSGVWLAGDRPQPPPNDYMIVSVVYRRAPGKTSFTAVTLPVSERFPPEQEDLNALREVRSAAAANATAVWIHAVSGAEYPGVIRGTSADNGATFTWTYEEEKGLPGNPQIRAVTTSDGVEGWAVGDWGQVKRWDGATWKPQAVTLTNLPTINQLNAVWATADRAYIVGDGIAMEWRKP